MGRKKVPFSISFVFVDFLFQPSSVSPLKIQLGAMLQAECRSFIYNYSVPSQLQAKIHAEWPSAMGFLLGCGTLSYGQHSKCADLLNSFLYFTVTFSSPTIRFISDSKVAAASSGLALPIAILSTTSVNIVVRVEYPSTEGLKCA